jgi:hypothetical protein
MSSVTRNEGTGYIHSADIHIPTDLSVVSAVATLQTGGGVTFRRCGLDAEMENLGDLIAK